LPLMNKNPQILPLSQRLIIKQKELLTRDVYIKDLLDKGASRAKIIAETTMKEVREKMGLTI
jgi:hypothetical protein